MLGWSHRIKFWIRLICQAVALFFYIGTIASISGGCEIDMFIVIFIGVVLFVNLAATIKRGY